VLKQINDPLGCGREVRQPFETGARPQILGKRT
jgi:hypothetical protein